MNRRYVLALLAVRVLLFPVLLVGLMIFPRIAFLWITGGMEAVHGWVHHIAFMGSRFEELGTPDQDARVRETYLTFATIGAVTVLLLIAHEVLRRKTRSKKHDALSQG